MPVRRKAGTAAVFSRDHGVARKVSQLVLCARRYASHGGTPHPARDGMPGTRISADGGYVRRPQRPFPIDGSEGPERRGEGDRPSESTPRHRRKGAGLTSPSRDEAYPRPMGSAGARVYEVLRGTRSRECAG